MSESQKMNTQEEIQNGILSHPIESEEELVADLIEIELTHEPTEQGADGVEVKNSEQDQKQREVSQSQLDAFVERFQGETNIDEKLLLAVNFMEASISQGGVPHFRQFWEARRLCLPLFKENVSSALRSQLWSRYSELSKEARRLKDLLDEQSAFAVEQIEIAIAALEKDIENFDEQVTKSVFLEENAFPQFLYAKRELYVEAQKQLNILNVQASRVNSLRKELLKTEMRVRHKNKFFQRLSLAGDKIFPRRKDLIKQVSHTFTEDIQQFIRSNFGDELVYDPSLYALREEIKNLQGLAKILTLNTSAFTQTRIRLSECWDQIKAKEKERKKERVQQKVLHKENAEPIRQEIQVLKEACENNTVTIVEAQKRIDDISHHMRQVDLGREEIKDLREALGEIRKHIQEWVKNENQARQDEEDERNRKKKEKYREMREAAESLLNRQDSLDADTLTKERDELLSTIQEAPITKIEKQEVERLLKPLKDVITDKREKALLDLSDDDRQALQQLKDVLQQRKKRRDEVKAQLEQLRKSAGSSSLDFEKAMSYTEQINEEKERLEKITQGVKEIESKISQLQSKTR